MSSLHLGKNPHRAEARKRNNLHNPIPVVPGRHPEECEESHAKVVKGSVAAKTLARVIVGTLWKRMKRGEALEAAGVGEEREASGEKKGSRV